MALVPDGVERRYNLSFPPFPSTEGRDVIPFSQFVPKGLYIPQDGDDDDVVEVDAEGVPTTELLGITHELDKSRLARNKRNPVRNGDAKAYRPWHEQWAENEVLMRAERLDPANHGAFDCLIQADTDFQAKRYFPLRVRHIYDHLRVFLGIITKINKNHPKRDFPAATRAAADDAVKMSGPALENNEHESDVDYADDDEDMPRAELITGATGTSFELPNQPLPDSEDEEPYTGALEPLPTRLDLLPGLRAAQFLADPPLAIACFFSHEFRNNGLNWAEFNLSAAPIIVTAFLQFLLRHKLLPEEYTRGLQAAVEVSKQALKELPQIRKAAFRLPDGWGQVCLELWGSKQPEDEAWGEARPLPISTTPNESHHTEAAGGLIEIDGVAANVASLSLNDPSSTTDEVQDPTIERNETYNNDVSDWGASLGEMASWEDPKLTAPTLFSYVGMAMFPLTHAPVRAESSTREILAILPPKDAFLARTERRTPPSHLHANLATLILGPWTGRGGGLDTDIGVPRILPVHKINKREHNAQITELDENNDNDENQEKHLDMFFMSDDPIRTHDPAKDTITVFVDPVILPHFIVGLGINGLFVQVARRLDASDSQVASKPRSDNASSGKKKKGPLMEHELDEGRIWWYIDSVSQMVPSFWTNTTDLPESEETD